MFKKYINIVKNGNIGTKNNKRRVKKFSRDDDQQLLGDSKYRWQAPLELLFTSKILLLQVSYFLVFLTNSQLWSLERGGMMVEWWWKLVPKINGCLRKNFREGTKVIWVVESGENGRTKLGSFLVFLVFLVAENGMGWMVFGIHELGNWLRVLGWSVNSLHAALMLPIEYVSGGWESIPKEMWSEGICGWVERWVDKWACDLS